MVWWEFFIYNNTLQKRVFSHWKTLTNYHWSSKNAPKKKLESSIIDEELYFKRKNRVVELEKLFVCFCKLTFLLRGRFPILKKSIWMKKYRKWYWLLVILLRQRLYNERDFKKIIFVSTIAKGKRARDGQVLQFNSWWKKGLERRDPKYKVSSWNSNKNKYFRSRKKLQFMLLR